LAASTQQIRAIEMVQQPNRPVELARDPLSELLRTHRPTAIVDIGANPIDGDPPYKPMLQKVSVA